MSDPFATTSPGLAGPAGRAFGVTPNDGADHRRRHARPLCRDGRRFVAHPQGRQRAGEPRRRRERFGAALAGRRVRATGTTASDIVGLY